MFIETHHVIRAKVLTTTIPLYYRTIGWQIWRKLRSERFVSEEAKENPEFFKVCFTRVLIKYEGSNSSRPQGSVLNYLACKNAGEDGHVGFFAFAKISALVLG